MVQVEKRKNQPYFLVIGLICLLLAPLLYVESNLEARTFSSAAPPQISPEMGHYAHAIVVKLKGNSADTPLFYSLDGSDPRTAGERYTTPIGLNTPDITVVRAAQQLPDGGWSHLSTATYIIQAKTHLPVFSLIAEPDGLFSAETGILRNPDGRGLNWERAAEIQFFEGERSPLAQTLAFSSPAGVRMHGSASRGYPKPSLRLYFRGAYGNPRLRYPLFSGQKDSALAEFDRLILHSGSQDYATPAPDPRSNWTLLRGTLLYELAAETQAYTTQGRPVLLFINGRSYGVYQLKTMPDETHMQMRYGVEALNMVALSSHPTSPNEIQSLEATPLWEQVLLFVENNDISEPAMYAQLSTMINIERMIDYVILEMYAGNQDWLRNNVRIFRDGQTGKWNYLIWDVDQAFGLAPWTSVDVNMVEWLFANDLSAQDQAPAIDSEKARLGRGSVVLRSLLGNEQFQQLYLARLDELLNTVLSAEKVTAQLDTMAAEIRPDIHFETNLWTSPGDWEASVAEMQDFVLHRPDLMRANHKAYFDAVPWE